MARADPQTTTNDYDEFNDNNDKYDNGRRIRRLPRSPRALLLVSVAKSKWWGVGTMGGKRKGVLPERQNRRFVL